MGKLAPGNIAWSDPEGVNDIIIGGRVAQWIRRLPTEQKIAGSILAVVDEFF